MKKIIALSLLFIVGFNIFVPVFSNPQIVSAGDNTCAGYTSTNNPYSCTGNGYCNGQGNCVWWAMYKRPDLINAFSSYPSAGSGWITNAQNAGYTIKNTVDASVVGAIAVWTGHVAYVENVYSNGRIQISEMNCYFQNPANAVRNPVPFEVDVNNYAGAFLGFITLPATNACNPPTNSDWVITTNCEITTNISTPYNVLVQGSGKLTIKNNAVLDIDFLNKKLEVQPTANVIIEPEGKIY